jgi:DNA modification methylase
MSVRIIVGDCRTELEKLADAGVRAQTCITSPPYWGLRDYGVEGQLGLEKDPREYVQKLVAIFADVAKVLRKDGTLWLNMGDCYTDGGRGADTGSTLNGTRRNQEESRKARNRENRKPFGLGRKQLIGMPWRVAFALQDAGWTLRSDIVWQKPNPMPESCNDRPTKAHEYLFLFSRTRHYYYDKHAIAEAVTGRAHPRGEGVTPKSKVPSGWDVNGDRQQKKGRYKNQHDVDGDAIQSRRDDFHERWEGKNERSGLRRYEGFNERWRVKQNESFSAAVTDLVSTRNARSVWTIPTAPYKGAHFATFPPALAERCIRAGSCPFACPVCGAAYRRLTRSSRSHQSNAARAGATIAGKGHPSRQVRAGHDVRNGPTTSIETLGWQPRCQCEHHGAVRQTVLDPFGGAGTTGLVSERLGRDSVLIELSDAYAAMAGERIDRDAGLFANTSIEEVPA